MARKLTPTQGHGMRRHFLYYVLCCPSPDTPPPVLTINSPSLDVTVGGSTNFTCIVDQPVSLEWEFEGHTHPATKYTTSQNGTVSVLVLETVIATDHGRYICRANGSFGSIFEDVFLRVRGEAPPTDSTLTQ